MNYFFRILSITAYLLIFLQGSMIQLPFGLMLTIGLLDAEPMMRVLLILADIALILLLLLPRTKWTPAIEMLIFVVLLLPLLKIFTSFSFEWFNYFLFLFPASCFIVFFLLSISFGYRKYKHEKELLLQEINFKT